MVSKRLELIFLTGGNRTYSLAIDDPREDLGEEETKNAMEKILNLGAFHHIGEDLIEAKKARIVTRQVEDIF